MTAKPCLSIGELKAITGRVIGTSPWMLADQPRIDAFADITEDHQPIHVDPVAAAGTIFGGTIAHGFLPLSLLSRMGETCLPQIEGVSTKINYGFDRVRIITPVPSGARIRGVFKLEELNVTGARTLVRYAVDIEIEGSDRPALSAVWLVMLISEAKEDA